MRVGPGGLEVFQGGLVGGDYRYLMSFPDQMLGQFQEGDLGASLSGMKKMG
jgi:hypothetical protein